MESSANNDVKKGKIESVYCPEGYEIDPEVRYFDIAANLTCEPFDGIYGGKQYHDADRDLVIQRALELNVDKLLIVGGHLEDTLKAETIISENESFWTTVGVHPYHAKVNHHKIHPETS